jgi:dTDP-4-dehydrorhamnose 3,5-epimerase-like enzyme
VDDQRLSVIELRDFGDTRGSSYGVPDDVLAGGFPLANIHITTIEPGSVRGNHYHRQRRELLVVMAGDRWSLHWDTGADTPVQRRDFDRPGVAMITVPIGLSHAVRNDGAAVLRVIGLTDGPYDPECPDAFPRVVVPAPLR